MGWQVGDSGYLKEPYLGYRCVEVVGIDGYGRLIVQLTSGLEITVNADDLES